MQKNPLNDNDHNGQSLGLNPKEDGIRHEDRYKCPYCFELFNVNDFNHEAGYCNECWRKHWGDVPGCDEAEYKLRDR